MRRNYAADTALFQKWQEENCLLRVEFAEGHISVRFTGILSYFSATELCISNKDDEVSISLFIATTKLIDQKTISSSEQHDVFSKNYAQVFQVTTDAGTNVFIYELPEA